MTAIDVEVQVGTTPQVGVTVISVLPTGPRGPAGTAGAAGEDGASAYEVAVAEGFVGDEAAWLASLVGEQGVPGSDADATALVAAEAATRAAADTALDGRVDTLEAVDPVLSVVAGDNVTIDATDPQNPIISAEAGGGGAVDSVNGETGVVVLSAADVGAATAAQGATADSAVQPGDLATVATSGDYDDLIDKPSIPSIAGLVNTANSPAAGEWAKFTDADTIEGRTPAELKADLDLEAGTDFLSPAAIAAAYQPLDGDLTTLAAAGNSAVLAATTASFTTADETKLDGIESGADVTDAANVAAAGAVMEADTTTAAMGFVIDEDDMASDSATKVPTQQSVKAYVDASAGGGGVTSDDITEIVALTQAEYVALSPPAIDVLYIITDAASPSTGLTSASGTYTGNSTNSRVITTGLSDLHYVRVLQTVGASSGDTVIGDKHKGVSKGTYTNLGSSVQLAAPATSGAGATIPDLSPANGTFLVSAAGGTGASLNMNSRTYEWFALGMA